MTPRGKRGLRLNGREKNHYNAEAPKGQDGKFWRARYIRGPLHLLTVPPIFARRPQKALLPREVVTRDLSR